MTAGRIRHGHVKLESATNLRSPSLPDAAVSMRTAGAAQVINLWRMAQIAREQNAKDPLTGRTVLTMVVATALETGWCSRPNQVNTHREGFARALADILYRCASGAPTPSPDEWDPLEGSMPWPEELEGLLR